MYVLWGGKKRSENGEIVLAAYRFDSLFLPFFAHLNILPRLFYRFFASAAVSSFQFADILQAIFRIKWFFSF